MLEIISVINRFIIYSRSECEEAKNKESKGKEGKFLAEPADGKDVRKILEKLISMFFQWRKQ